MSCFIESAVHHVQKDVIKLGDMLIQIEDSVLHLFSEKGIGDCGLKELLEKCGLEMCEESSLDVMWQQLSTHWDYTNISLLKHLVNRLGDESVQASTRDYVKKLEDFLCRTAVSSFAMHSIRIGKNLMEETFSSFIILVDQPPSNFMLKKLEGLRESLVFNLELPKFSLILQNIKFGTDNFIVRWAIPIKIASSLKRTNIMENTGIQSLCRLYRVGSITIDAKRYLAVKTRPIPKLAPGKQGNGACMGIS